MTCDGACVGELVWLCCKMMMLFVWHLCVVNAGRRASFSLLYVVVCLFVCLYGYSGLKGKALISYKDVAE